MTVLASMALTTAALGQGSSMKYVPVKGAPPALQIDVLEVDPEATIIRPLQYLKRGDTFVVPQGTSITTSEAWVQVLSDWVEPITGPGGRLPKIAFEDMLLLETFGYVSMKEPGKKYSHGKPATANQGDIIPNDAVLETRQGASAALLIGGLFSVRLGENTRASIKHRVIDNPGPDGGGSIWSTTVKLEAGYVFCKVGRRKGVEPRFSVRTESGRAVAKGTDYVVLVKDNRMAVGVAKGTVLIEDDSGKPVATAYSQNRSSLRILHQPPLSSAIDRMNADSVFLQKLLTFIPQINLKINDLRRRLSQGYKLTDVEQKYLDLVPRISFLKRVRREN